MVPNALSDLECQIQPPPIPFELLDDAKALARVGETGGVQLVDFFLSDVTERGMTEVVTKCDGLGQILVEVERAGNRPGDLGDL